MFVFGFNSIANCANAPWVGSDFNGRPCNGNEMSYGPFDYNNLEHKEKNLHVVESYHFTPEVQFLKKGKSGFLRDDLDYTLLAFPNHARSLTSSR